MLSVKTILCLNACLGIYLYFLLLPRGAYVEVLNEHHFFGVEVRGTQRIVSVNYVPKGNFHLELS